MHSCFITTNSKEALLAEGGKISLNWYTTIFIILLLNNRDFSGRSLELLIIFEGVLLRTAHFYIRILNFSLSLNILKTS